LVGGLAAANVARTAVVPKRWHLAWNLAMGAGAVAVARGAGLGAAELGLARRQVPAGLKVGGVAFGAISAAVAAAAGTAVAIGLAAGELDDDRTDVSAAEMAQRVLLVIPIGTVLVEELAFRGALHGLLERTALPTLAVGSVLFGLWHVAPIWSDGPLVVAGTLVATTAAGAGFTWLRQRSDSVVAPTLAHLATNSTTFALVWWATRAG
jgi:membrane protease YdiL (CAAX protease family)